MSELRWDEIDRRAVDTARVLAADAVEKVGNGHPGTAMSLAPAAYLLYQHVMRHDPADMHWAGRDRFILSAGHSSLTQYVQLYLGGFGLELDDLKALRTWGSLTPGHPEFGHTDGVEITTGPLGQGLASSVGFAYAARYERGLFDPDAAPGTSPFDHFIYVIASDGDLQEGVTSEASSLAGHQELGNLVVLYDSNQISIEDDTNVAFTEDVAARYEAYGWHVQTVDWKKTGEYVEDVAELYAAIEAAKGETSQAVDHRPEDDHRLALARQAEHRQDPRLRPRRRRARRDQEGARLGPRDDLRRAGRRARAHPLARASAAPTARAEWQESFDAWAAANPERKALFDRLQARELPEGIADALPVFEAGKEVSTRAASGTVINALAAELPELWGGSADLAESNLTTIKAAKSFIPSEWSTHEWSGDPYGRVLHFGIREHAMGAIVNGIVLHGPTRAFGGTFLIFSDYMRPSVRIAALMNIPSIYVWTHDSVALGEDGPTHQPIEQLATLRAIPNFTVVRPADANETARGLARAAPPPRRPRRPRAHPPEHPGVRARRGRGIRRRLRLGRQRRQGRVRARRGAERHARRDPHRHRLRGAARGRRPRDARRRGHQRPRRVGAVAGVVRRAGRGVPRVGAAGIRHRPRLGRGRHRASPGATSSATRAAPCRSSTSARPPTTRPCSRSSASPPTPSSQAARETIAAVAAAQ